MDDEFRSRLRRIKEDLNFRERCCQEYLHEANRRISRKQELSDKDFTELGQLLRTFAFHSGFIEHAESIESFASMSDELLIPYLDEQPNRGTIAWHWGHASDIVRQVQRLAVLGEPPEGDGDGPYLGLTLIHERFEVQRTGYDPVVLTPLEWRLFFTLFEAKETGINHEDALNRVWGDGGSLPSLRNTKSSLERKLLQIGVFAEADHRGNWRLSLVPESI